MLTLPTFETPKVSIVVVTARRTDRLIRCLGALVRGSLYSAFVGDRNHWRFRTKWAEALTRQATPGELIGEAPVTLRNDAPAAHNPAKDQAVGREMDQADRLLGHARRDVAFKNAFLEHALKRLAEATDTHQLLADDAAAARRALRCTGRHSELQRRHASLADAHERLAREHSALTARVRRRVRALGVEGAQPDPRRHRGGAAAPPDAASPAPSWAAHRSGRGGNAWAKWSHS